MPSPVKPDPVRESVMLEPAMVAVSAMGWIVPLLMVAVNVGLTNVPVTVRARVPVGVFVMVPVPFTVPVFRATASPAHAA
jgi:hypothetical protein